MEKRIRAVTDRIVINPELLSCHGGLSDVRAGLDGALGH
jgi:hypothetical protein